MIKIELQEGSVLSHKPLEQYSRTLCTLSLQVTSKPCYPNLQVFVSINYLLSVLSKVVSNNRTSARWVFSIFNNVLMFLFMFLFSLVSDIEGGDALQLRKEHALKIFAYINSWTQR